MFQAFAKREAAKLPNENGFVLMALLNFQFLLFRYSCSYMSKSTLVDWILLVLSSGVVADFLNRILDKCGGSLKFENIGKMCIINNFENQAIFVSLPTKHVC